jgi:hypothetical protein
LDALWKPNLQKMTTKGQLKMEYTLQNITSSFLTPAYLGVQSRSSGT